ncbi:MAG: hypothetical protein AAGF88_04055 [Pseudomonadota bacterium]
MVSEAVSDLREPEFTFPPDEGELVAREYARAAHILEYGSGGSTVLAARSTDAQVLSIESDKAWAENLSAYLQAQNISMERVIVHWADIGPTGKWGYPTDQSKWRKYPGYALCPWDEFDIAPDVVLIDGRFRLACLAATLLFATKPTTVLFDDFNHREVYQVARQFIKPVQSVGRMAKFEIEPSGNYTPELAAMIRWFFVLK